jgi:hypothetical protein
VAVFTSDGTVSLHEKTGRQLGVPVRDMSLFQRPQHHFSAAPRIAIRDETQQILVRTELLRAIVQRDSLVLFECKCDSSVLAELCIVLIPLHLYTSLSHRFAVDK